MAQKSGRRFGMVVVLVCLPLFASCAESVTAQQLTDSIMRSDAANDAIALTESQADCMADELMDSGLGDTTLVGLAENFDTPNILAVDADDVQQVIVDAAIVCADSSGG